MKGWNALTALLMLAAAVAGCTVSGLSADSDKLALCSSPQRGKRYAVCGQLTTGGLNGSVNASTPTAQSRFTIAGGTFHASR